VACHGIAALWISAALAWSALRVESGAPSLARIEPRPELREPGPPEPPPPEPRQQPEPPPEPEPPQPAPEPPPAAAPTPAPVSRADLAAGAALLDAAGGFPVLSCSYEDFGSFAAYARAMAALGARFVVVRQRQILGVVDLESGRVEEGAPAGSFSPRARDYTGEPGLAEIELAARGRFGRGAVVMMLVPRELDAGLFGAIARELAERGERHSDYREVRGRYARAPGGGVWLRVDSGVRSDGRELRLDRLFDLGRLADPDGRPRA
jgi:hypothetical protein